MAARIALLLASVLLTLVLFEAAIRVGLVQPLDYVISDAWWKEHWLRERKGGNPREFVELDPLLGWIPAAGLDRVPYEGVHISTNAAHMRGREEVSLARTAPRRVVTVGDSYTFGQCVEDDETWPAALERALPGTEVLNLGVMGYGQDQALLRMRRDGLPYRPDVVVFGFHPSNVRRNVLSFRDYAKPRFRLDGSELELVNVPVPPPSRYAVWWPPRLWNFVVMFRDSLRSRDPAFRRHMRALSEAIVYRMAEEAQEAGARLAVVYLPHPVNLGNPGPFGWPPIRQRCEEGDPETFLCVDPVPRLRALLPDDEESVREAFACHFSAPVQEAVGRAVADTLRARGPAVFRQASGPARATDAAASGPLAELSAPGPGTAGRRSAAGR